MASIYKRTRTKAIPANAEIKDYRGKPHAHWSDGKGRKRREPLNDAGDRMVVADAKYSIEYFDHAGKRQRVAGASDKAASERIARKLETTEAEYQHGSRDQRAERIGQHERADIETHLRDFEAALEGKGTTAKHVDNTLSYIRAMVNACNFKTAGDIDAATVSSHAGDLLRQGKGKNNINHKLTAIKQLTKWLHECGRLRTNPLAGLKKLNDNTDRRRQRRNLSDDEAARLIQATRQGQPFGFGNEHGKREHPHSLSGPDRALLYELALGSGLRASELASLTVASFDLSDPDHATVTVEAGYSKHRREDRQPIPAHLARKLARHFEGRRQREQAFTMPPVGKIAAMLRADLKAARVAWLAQSPDGTAEQRERAESGFLAYCDDAGRYADFHSLRHTYISRLARSGVHPKTAQKLARHASITLTMDHYTHSLRSDERDAVADLPALGSDESEPQGEAANPVGTIGERSETG